MTALISVCAAVATPILGTQPSRHTACIVGCRFPVGFQCNLCPQACFSTTRNCTGAESTCSIRQDFLNILSRHLPWTIDPLIALWKTIRVCDSCVAGFDDTDYVLDEHFACVEAGCKHKRIISSVYGVISAPDSLSIGHGSPASCCSVACCSPGVGGTDCTPAGIKPISYNRRTECIGSSCIAEKAFMPL